MFLYDDTRYGRHLERSKSYIPTPYGRRPSDTEDQVPVPSSERRFGVTVLRVLRQTPDMTLYLVNTYNCSVTSIWHLRDVDNFTIS